MPFEIRWVNGFAWKQIELSQWAENLAVWMF